MSNIRDLAVGSVLTAPSPATSGTTLVLQTGEGADMPTTLPYKLLVFPTGAVPSKANSEKVLVTAQTDDTLTIERAQGETTAKNIAAGWLVANAVFTEDIFNSAFVTGEVPAGTIDGTNDDFTLASTPTTSSVQVFLNGVRQKITDDYTVSGSTITFVTAPPTSSNILVDYSVGAQGNSVGTNSYIAKEAVTGSIDGSNAVFTTARAYIAGSLEVYVNGLKQGTAHLTETAPSSGTFTLDVAPATGDVVEVAYQYNLNPSGNADTVDGYHLEAIMQAIYPVGSVYVSGSDTMPELISQVGTWVRLKGRVIVGVDETQTEFDTVNEEGGAKTHTLTTDEMPSHDHNMTYGINTSSAGGNVTVMAGGTAYNSRIPISNEGGGQAHNNLQPYKAKFMWERTV